MHFSLLGPVEATQGGRAIPLGGRRQRALLARLLVDANRAVAADRLADDLWELPPQDSHAALQNQVSRLRKVLGDRLVTRAPGYLLRVDPGELDLDVFRGLVAEAGAAADPAERARLLREADALFRGPPLADVDAPFAESEQAALEELRLAAVEGRIDADLERGRHAELVPELGALVRAHPLRERLRGQQILALYRCGRQADALEAYRETRRMLDEELGLEPSPALRELERAILVHDESLTPDVPPDEQVSVAPVAEEAPPTRRTWVVGVAAGAALALAGTAVALVLVTHTGGSPEPVAAPTSNGATTSQQRVVVHRRTHAPHHHAKTRPASVTTVELHPRTTPVKPVAPATTPAAVTTRAETTTSRPAGSAKHRTKPAAPTSTTRTTPPRTITDDFSETSPDYSLWNPGGDGTGGAWALQNGQLVFTIPASAQPGGQYDQVGPVWGSQCRFDGNFDERIDYQLLQWPHGSGARVQLDAWVFSTSDFSASGRVTASDSETYAGNINRGWNQMPTTDTTGTLRVARVGPTETAYYETNGKWVAIHSGPAPGETQLGIQLFAVAGDWQHQDVSVAFDNFKVTATNFWCP
jgi:DNA-binding SARP family transcriptional activator